MGKRNPAVDAYIANAAAFAQPVLNHLRERVHAACPDVEEAIKWSMPFFVYRGNLCNMAAFKTHCAFGFWKGDIVVGANASSDEAMGQFGRIAQLSDLPPDDTLAAYIAKAMQLNADGVKPQWQEQRKTKPPAVMPHDFAASLKQNAKAHAVFEAFTPGKRREYIDWITEAKTAATRSKRIATSVEWIAQGKVRNWKYLDC